MPTCPACGTHYPSGERFCGKDGAALSSEPTPLRLPVTDLSGAMIGTYQLVRKLGEGGMGAVYEAIHPVLSRHIAIKIVHPSHARDPQVVARFFDEARALGRLRHRAILEVYDLGQLEDGTVFLEMELLSGRDLRSRLREGPLPPKEIREKLALAAEGLGAAHEKGLIHRDLKPENVFLCDDGGVKILDFGVVKLADATEAFARTKTGVILGTPEYMSPEQAAGKRDLDARSDIYSFGLILYEALCGRRPFDAESLYETLNQQVQGVFPTPEARAGVAVDAALSAAAMRCLEKSPAARFSTMAEVTAALAVPAPSVVLTPRIGALAGLSPGLGVVVSPSSSAAGTHPPPPTAAASSPSVHGEGGASGSGPTLGGEATPQAAAPSEDPRQHSALPRGDSPPRGVAAPAGDGAGASPSGAGAASDTALAPAAAALPAADAAPVTAAAPTAAPPETVAAPEAATPGGAAAPLAASPTREGAATGAPEGARSPAELATERLPAAKPPKRARGRRAAVLAGAAALASAAALVFFLISRPGEAQDAPPPAPPSLSEAVAALPRGVEAVVALELGAAREAGPELATRLVGLAGRLWPGAGALSGEGVERAVLGLSLSPAPRLLAVALSGPKVRGAAEALSRGGLVVYREAPGLTVLAAPGIPAGGEGAGRSEALSLALAALPEAPLRAAVLEGGLGWAAGVASAARPRPLAAAGAAITLPPGESSVQLVLKTARPQDAWDLQGLFSEPGHPLRRYSWRARGADLLGSLLAGDGALW